MISDSFLFDASSIFFLAWTLTIMGLCVAAFGRDLLPAKVAAKPPRIPLARPQQGSESLVSSWKRTSKLRGQSLKSEVRGQSLKSEV
jgi:hypothetical protein